MKIAIVYNHDFQNVINLFGIPNKEKIGQSTIKRIANALKAGGHQVKAIEGDKDLINKLEEFMPRVLKGEQPGLVFNLSYGIQGQARYTHVPSILEMVGIPYVGSGPLAHGMALDKVVAKTIFNQHGLPTPDFTVLNSWENMTCELPYPLIVKPKHEAVSFGVRIVRSETELHEAVQFVEKEFQQPVLVEQYIDGSEINVGLIGNNPVEALMPVELIFGKGGPAIYTYEDKTHRSGRKIGYNCPASISKKQIAEAQDLARRAFKALGCYDFARVDMRLDKKGRFYILEVNSLPSLGGRGSYLVGAEHLGLDFTATVNRMVEAASARYFGTPRPQRLSLKNADRGSLLLNFVTQRRDQIERRIATWINVGSRTYDPVGIRESLNKLGESLEAIGLRPVKEFTNHPSVVTWQTSAGFAEGTLLIGHMDIPLGREVPRQGFHRDPEWLYGEGIGLSRSALVMLEFALRGLKHVRRLKNLPLGILYYTDEGQDCENSAEMIRTAASKAKQVLVLRAGNPGNKIITQRRGQRKYLLTVEAAPRRIGKAGKDPDILSQVCAKIEKLAKLSSRKDRVAVAASNMETTSFPMLLPHRIVTTLLLSYPDQRTADRVEKQMRQILRKDRTEWSLEMLADRPAMKLSRGNQRLAKDLKDVADKWDIPLDQESSVWPTIAGLVPKPTRVVCGLGPVSKQLCTPHEAVQRISVLQRTLLLAEFLMKQLEGTEKFD
ncbi:MAG: ATP-grasp domain-containing protein [Planctomycetota bacterium]